MEIKMKVLGLAIDPVTSSPIVILRDDSGKYSLPIWIGVMEASAIAMELENVKFSRPLTHDLIKNILHELKVAVEKIVVTDLRDNTYFALIYINKEGKSHKIDSRPSDAIAIALRTGSPIYVEDSVITKSQKLEMSLDVSRAGMSEEEYKKKLAELLDKLNPEDFGKYKM